MEKQTRRSFLQTVGGAVGGIVAASALPAFGRAQFALLGVSAVRIEAGATTPFSALHISDTHLTLAWPEERDSGDLLARARARSDEYGGDQLEALRASIRWAKDHNDLLIHTGDLIDWPSRANLAAVKGWFGGMESVIGCLGNHEYYCPWVADSTTAAGRERLRGVLRESYPFAVDFSARVVNGVNLVSMDNADGSVTPEQVTKFKAEAAKGLPIVLLQHVPFDLPNTVTAHRRFWNGRPARFDGTSPKLRDYDATTAAFIAYLKGEKLLKGILAGHLHITSQERFSPTAMQYVVGANYLRVAQEVYFV